MTVVMALTLEWLLGDPGSRWHPVAWFGRWAHWCESWLYDDDRRAGMAAWLFVTGLPFAMILLLHGLSGRLFDALLLWLCIGWKSLFAHVKTVLEAQTLSGAQQAVSRIVSRDVDTMDMADTRCAALESLAENASDAVLAPLFWFVLLGAPGAALYRMINTLDAMWGYRTKRYRRFGWWSARADDLANWLPARITARLLLWAGRDVGWQQVRAQAQTHASPNAGWPEAALAWSAGVRLGGPVVRGGIIEQRPWYGPSDACRADAGAVEALKIVRHALGAAALLAFGMSLVF